MSPTHILIDLDAFRANVRLVRQIVGPSVKLFAVCKGDGYGCGAPVMAQAAIDAGADAIGVANAEDALAVRAAGVRSPILLYPSTLPEAFGALARRDISLTVHNFESLQGMAQLPEHTRVYVKVNCGLNRFGFNSSEWEHAFRALRRSGNIRVDGVYTHLPSPQDPSDYSRTEAQVQSFRQACAVAERVGFSGFARMLASSPFLPGKSEWHFTAIDPGRLLYDLVHDGDRGPAMGPVLLGVKSNVIHISSAPPGSHVSYQRLDPRCGPMRIGVIPTGFAAGFPRSAPGDVLVGGVRTPIVGARNMEHALVDLSAVPHASVGSEAVLVGRQGDEEITWSEVAARCGLSVLELCIWLGRNLTRVYVGSNPGKEPFS